MRSPTSATAVSFWSLIPAKGRWVGGTTVPPTTAHTTNREFAERQVRTLRAGGRAAYAHAFDHTPKESAPLAWMFNPTGRLWIDD